MLGKKLLTWGAKVGAALLGAWLGTMIGGGNLGGGIGLLIGLAAAEVIIWLRGEPEGETNTIIPEDAIPQPKPDQHVKRGMDYLGQADFHRALVEFREAQTILGDLRDDRSRLRALIGLALSEWAAGNIPSAEAALEFAQLRPIRAISQELQAVFSAVQTAWRRGRDSPRPLKIKAKPLVLRIGLEFSQLYWGLLSAI